MKMEPIYVSSHCNFAHRLGDGKPIEHECRIIPTRALTAEINGEIEKAIEIMVATPAVIMRRGVRRREMR